MFKHIIIPLDGSGLAETVLPMAVNLAVDLNSKVTLLHIIEKDAAPVIHGDRHLTTTQEAGSYLKGIRKQHFPMDLAGSLHVHTTATRNVADGIINHQAELSPDLIIICTHGRSGLRPCPRADISKRFWPPPTMIRNTDKDCRQPLNSAWQLTRG